MNEVEKNLFGALFFIDSPNSVDRDFCRWFYEKPKATKIVLWSFDLIIKSIFLFHLINSTTKSYFFYSFLSSALLSTWPFAMTQIKLRTNDDKLIITSSLTELKRKKNRLFFYSNNRNEEKKEWKEKKNNRS